MNRWSFLVFVSSLGCGGGVVSTPSPDDAGPTLDAADEPQGDAPEEPQGEAESSACFAQGVPCFFVDGGGACCAGLFCNATDGGAATCEPGVPICLTFETPCGADGGFPCCAGLICALSTPAQPRLRCVVPGGA